MSEPKDDPEFEVTAPDASIITNPEIKHAIHDLAEEMVGLNQTVAMLEERKKVLKLELELELTKAGLASVRWPDEFTVTKFPTKSPSKLDKEKLLKSGVTIAQIQAATVPGTPRIEVKVTPAKKAKK